MTATHHARVRLCLRLVRRSCTRPARPWPAESCICVLAPCHVRTAHLECCIASSASAVQQSPSKVRVLVPKQAFLSLVSCLIQLSSNQSRACSLLFSPKPLHHIASKMIKEKKLLGFTAAACRDITGHAASTCIGHPAERGGPKPTQAIGHLSQTTARPVKEKLDPLCGQGCKVAPLMARMASGPPQRKRKAPLPARPPSPSIPSPTCPSGLVAGFDSSLDLEEASSS
ncbi:hypothetical protein V8C34DRAFT_139314 [Trichoderma compactum]